MKGVEFRFLTVGFRKVRTTQPTCHLLKVLIIRVGWVERFLRNPTIFTGAKYTLLEARIPFVRQFYATPVVNLMLMR